MRQDVADRLAIELRLAWRIEVLTCERDDKHQDVRSWKTLYQGPHEDYARKLFTEQEMRGAGNSPTLTRLWDQHLIDVRLTELSGPAFRDERVLLHVYWR
jgi:hypothetical protein